MDFISFLPDFGGIAWTIAAFVVALSIIVFIHEFGHYIVGRWSGIHAEVFSLGFGPVLWSRSDKRGTKWQLAAIPLGGFVKFLGDSNAASGKDAEVISHLSAEERRHTMHGAPLWARAATVAAGPVFNFILSIVVFAGLALFTGVATERAVVGEVPAMPSGTAELLPGDRILSLNGKPTPDLTALSEVIDGLTPAPTVSYELERDGKVIVVDGPFPEPPLVGSVQPLTAAFEAGIREGDFIQSINGTRLDSFGQMRGLIGASDGKPVDLVIWRDGKTLNLTLTPKRTDLPKEGGGFETRWLLGLGGGLFFTPELRTAGPFESIGIGAERTWDVFASNLSGLGHMIMGAISSCNLRSPIGIARLSGAVATQGLPEFIAFIAMLSTAVGMLNLFPIPILDGGHLVFHAYEAITRKPPTERALRLLMTGGLSVLLALLVFAVSNDLFCP